MTFRTIMATGAALALLSLIPAVAADSVLTAKIAGAQRSADNKARDAARHPAETLDFWGIKPGQTIIEVSPGGGYWSEILAPYAKDTKGHYIAATARPDQKLPAKFEDANVYGPIHYSLFNKGPAELGAPGSADVVITARNIHNWMWTPGMADSVMANFYAVLKPGGILAVEEHRADPKPMVNDARNGYVSTQHVIDLAQKVGFKLEARSEINANAKDSKDHPFGVWTLPPVRRSAEQGKPADPSFDRTMYDAIGESDRMTLLFRKP